MILPDEDDEDSLGAWNDKKKKKNLAETLMKDFSELPKAKKTDLDEYAVINVSPSVVPNPYLPSFRVFAYNVTGAPSISVIRQKQQSDDDASATPENFLKEIKGSKRKHGHRHPKKDREVDCAKKEYRDTWACRPKKKFYADEDAPSRRNQLWTPLGYAQVSGILLLLILFRVGEEGICRFFALLSFCIPSFVQDET